MQNQVKIKSILQTQKLFRHNLDLLIVCISLLTVGVFLNGINALIQAVLCVGTCVVCEFLGSKFVLKKFSFEDLSAITTGLIITLMLPAYAPLYISIIAGAVAILVAKLPFGSAQSTPFVPACVGFCAVSVMYPQYVFAYLEKSATFSFFPDLSETLTSGKTLLEYLMMGNSISFNLFTVLELLSGSFAGAIGTTSILALLGAFLYLVIQNPKRIYPALGYIGMCIVFAIVFPRVSSGIFTSVIMELCAGSLIFTALILISDPITSPKTPKFALLYGAFAGAIYMLLRYYGKVEDPACFSVLIANAISLVFKNKVEHPSWESFDVIELEEVKELIDIIETKQAEEEIDETVYAQLQEIKEQVQEQEGLQELEIEKRDADDYVESIIQVAHLDKKSAMEQLDKEEDSLQKINEEIDALQETLFETDDTDKIEIELEAKQEIEEAQEETETQLEDSKEDEEIQEEVDQENEEEIKS